MSEPELFEKKELDPTVKVMVAMNQSEKIVFKKFADEMNINFSAFVRMACKSFMKGEGLKYVER